MFQGGWHPACLPPPLPNEYAYVKGRRCEAAIKQQLIIGWRLRANHISHDTTSYDMKNAFGSVELTIISNVFGYLVQPCDWLLFKQRFMCATTHGPALSCMSVFFA